MIKSVGVGLMGSALAVIVLVFVIILMFRIGFIGVAATGSGGIGSVPMGIGSLLMLMGIGPVLIAAIVGFVIGFRWMLRRQPA